MSAYARSVGVCHCRCRNSGRGRARLVGSRGGDSRGADDGIGLSLPEFGFDYGEVEGRDVQIDAGRGLGNSREHRREKAHLPEVGRVQPEGSARRRWVELSDTTDRAVDDLYRLAQCRIHRRGEFGGLKTPGGSAEQVVVELFPHPAERVTDGWLGERQAFGRARDTPGLVQQQECPHQIQVVVAHPVNRRHQWGYVKHSLDPSPRSR